MLKFDKKFIISIYLLFSLSAIIFTIIDWNIGSFDFIKPQNYEFYFHSWVSFAGFLFSLIMTVTTFIIYKKNQVKSIKLISISFLLTSFAYAIIGYHTSYCKVCSDIAMCGASHNYPNYFILITLIIITLNILLLNLKNSINLLKLFSFGLIVASLVLLLTLFISMEYMQVPELVSNVIININFQGLVFILPMILILLSFLYFKRFYKLSNATVLIFLIMFIAFIPQAYHIFTCRACHDDECSEFFIFSGLFMLIAIGTIIYSIKLQLEERSTKNDENNSE